MGKGILPPPVKGVLAFFEPSVVGRSWWLREEVVVVVGGGRRGGATITTVLSIEMV